jgi:hypothetical protein
MTTPFPFVSGQVLTAAELNDIQNLPISDKTASYTLVATDVFKRTIMNNAGATTITVDDSIFTVGDVIQVANKGAGTCTITAGAGVTINTSGSLDLAQYGGGYLLALSASTFTFFNLGGGSAYGTATGGIGSPTAVNISGVDYEYLTFNSTGTLTITKSGFFDYCAVGGGGGSLYTSGGNTAGGGGGAGVLLIGSIYLDANQTITIGGGGSVNNLLSSTKTQGTDTIIAATSPFTKTASGNLATVSSNDGVVAGFTGGGFGSMFGYTTTVTTTAYGRNGGNSGTSTNGGGGGGNSAAGGNGSGTTGGTGGAGFDVSVFIGSSALFKAMGGGGGGSVTGGSAATDGVAGSTNSTPPNGNVNSGGGGGAGASSSTTTGNGGSGICYIRWVV